MRVPRVPLALVLQCRIIKANGEMGTSGHLCHTSFKRIGARHRNRGPVLLYGEPEGGVDPVIRHFTRNLEAGAVIADGRESDPINDGALFGDVILLRAHDRVHQSGANRHNGVTAQTACGLLSP